ncbi:hypothetical protein PQX77_000308 [Marasmius sp. AFHP31]|nr:hypothetical protein PQX77_000308 [Marasmius sp. AFHP31]
MSHNGYHPNTGRCVSLQQIHGNPGLHTQAGGSHTTSHRRQSSSITNPALLAPGAVHQLPGFFSQQHGQQYHYTPEAVLTGAIPSYAKSEFTQHLRKVEYLARRPEHCGRPFTEAPICFSVNGVPGPYLSQLVRGEVVVDRPNDPIFAHLGWSRTSLAFDFPGLRTLPVARINTLVESDKHPITRQEFAREVAYRISEMIREGKAELQNPTSTKYPSYAQYLVPGEERWRLDRVKARYLRLVAVNFYGKNWVPVLAVDVGGQ